jgi:hypothetical protein
LKRIRLALRQGEHVGDIELPPLAKLPDVIAWGLRTFAFYQELNADGDPCCAEYREVFAFYVAPGQFDRDARASS